MGTPAWGLIWDIRGSGLIWGGVGWEWDGWDGWGGICGSRLAWVDSCRRFAWRLFRPTPKLFNSNKSSTS